ncbi:MAG: DUF4388 domain-containing protein [Candidatus Nitrospinota bacterium M3_3B_026]
MALKGSLDDFNIMNILQMIKLEGKTGRLTLTEKDETVRITFDNGAIIYAESSPQRDETRLGGSLVSNAVISPQEWSAVKKEHEDKLKPYWDILARRISTQTLVEFIRRQVIDNVYYALRWKKGEYEFAPMKGVKYNNKVMTPMDVDALLMEGCRVADEWPRVAAGLPPFDTFIVKNIIGEEEEDDSLAAKPRENAQGDFRSSLEYDILSARGVTLSDQQVAVLSVIGQGKSIRETLDSARQGSFESLEAIKSLLELGIIKPAKKKKEETKTADRAGLTMRLVITAALLAVVVGGLYWQMARWPELIEAQKSGMSRVNAIQARGGLKKIARGLEIYNVLRGGLPESLDQLAKAGIIRQPDLLDPWNNPYRFEKSDGEVALYSTGPDVFLPNDDVLFTPPGS